MADSDVGDAWEPLLRCHHTRAFRSVPSRVSGRYGIGRPPLAQAVHGPPTAAPEGDGQSHAGARYRIGEEEISVETRSERRDGKRPYSSTCCSFSSCSVTGGNPKGPSLRSCPSGNNLHRLMPALTACTLTRRATFPWMTRRPPVAESASVHGSFPAEHGNQLPAIPPPGTRGGRLPPIAQHRPRTGFHC